jgi:hypothetical protein
MGFAPVILRGRGFSLALWRFGLAFVKRRLRFGGLVVKLFGWQRLKNDEPQPVGDL